MRNSGRDPAYIVGIGGSAGGLEAFEEFFRNMPPESGMAFVVVQHLDPTYKGMLPELLQRHSAMPVHQIKDDMRVEPNSIYVIPPNKDLAILHGKLQLLDPSSPRGLRLPIDLFLKHLSQDQGERAVAVILSGMGTDGTQGMRSIKEKLGMAMVQDPETAKFDGMPKSAISTGLADYIASTGELPAKLLEYAKHQSVFPKASPALGEQASSALQKIMVLLRAQTRQDFSLYKKDTLNRRIMRRMNVHLIENPDEYVRYLQENPYEVDLLFKELLIGVTTFFRDAEAFNSLKERLANRIRSYAQEPETLRAWIVGCSSGEEAFSIAIILRECLDAIQQRSGIDIQVFATDIDKEAIEIARRGVYPLNITAEVSPERLQRFFIKEEDKYRVKKEIRDTVVFAPQNVIMDPPFTRMDLVSCRNLLIYFSPELQKKVLPLFNYSLKPEGILFLGSSESIGEFGGLFATLDSKHKVFERRRTETSPPTAVEFPISRAHPKVDEALPVAADKGTGIVEVARQCLMESYTPPAVLVNDQGDILYFNGHTGKYLEPSAGKANLNIYAMAREGLRNEIGIAIRKAVSQSTDITIKAIKFGINEGEQAINLTVKPITKRDRTQTLLMVIFQDVEKPRSTRRRKPAFESTSEDRTVIEQLEEELKYSKERLQDNVEQMQATAEELQSSNEELQSSNEELQSTNEELTTSKEEMQSLNEELSTVNFELQSKVDELSLTSSDMMNLMNSTTIATIFLDNHLNIKRFTPEAAKIIKVRETDVGRPVSDLVSNLKDVDLARDAEAVLKTLVFKEMQVQTIGGGWYMTKILPYRTLDNAIDGVVITFADITQLKSLEQSLLSERNYAQGIVATIREPIIVLNGELNVVSANGSFYKVFHTLPEETEGHFIYNLGNGQWNIPALKQLLETIVSSSSKFDDYVVEHDFEGIGRKRMLLNARRLESEAGGSSLILLAIEEEKQR